MRCLDRNKMRFFYALYRGKEQLIDEYGNNTGEYEVLFDNPQEGFANISAAQGETETRQFGDDEAYDKVIVMDNTHPPINEYSVLWIDTIPLLNEDGGLAINEKGETVTPYDYVVKKVAKSLNSVSIAISKVNVSG